MIRLSKMGVNFPILEDMISNKQMEDELERDFAFPALIRENS